MRKIIVLSFITLDGVMQAPGGPDEDTKNSFSYGGWAVPYWDKGIEKEMGKQMGGEFDLLLGRKTYDIFAKSWPEMDPENVINKFRKYVVTSQPIPADTEVWKGTIGIDGDFIERIKALKMEDGPDLQVHGSGQLIQALLKNELIDEFWLKIYPITLGTGDRLFDTGTVPTAFKLIETDHTPSGIILAKYEKAGVVTTGSF